MALHAAARSGDLEKTRQLLKAGDENVNARDNHSRTPLHLAAWAGHVEVVHLLLEHKAQPSATAVDDMTAIHFASQKGHVEVVRALLGGGAKASSVTRKGYCPLHYASQNGHLDIVRLLMKNEFTRNPKRKSPNPIQHEIDADSLDEDRHNEKPSEASSDRKTSNANGIESNKLEAKNVEKSIHAEEKSEKLRDDDDGTSDVNDRSETHAKIEKNLQIEESEGEKNLKRSAVEKGSTRDSVGENRDAEVDAKDEARKPMKKQKVSLAHLNADDGGGGSSDDDDDGGEY